MLTNSNTENENKAARVVDLVREVTRMLVDFPDDVEVNCDRDGEISVIRVKVAVSDVGKVIGKHGQTARALRTFLRGASQAQKCPMQIEFLKVEEERAA